MPARKSTHCKSGSRSVCRSRSTGATSPRRGKCPKGSNKRCMSGSRTTKPRRSSSSRRRTTKRKVSSPRRKVSSPRRRKTTTKRRASSSTRRKSVPCRSGTKSVCRNRSTGRLSPRRGRCENGSSRECVESDMFDHHMSSRSSSVVSPLRMRLTPIKASPCAKKMSHHSSPCSKMMSRPSTRTVTVSQKPGSTKKSVKVISRRSSSMDSHSSMGSSCSSGGCSM